MFHMHLPQSTMVITKFFPCLFLATLFLSSFLIPPVKSTVPRRSIGMNRTASISQFLNGHNAVRARHSIPPLRWSTKLANYATWYANQRRGDCALVHSSGDYGENIFWGKGKQWKPSDAVAAWAAQEAYYSYEENSCMPNKDCLHYTQVVWRNTRNIGCAQVKCKSGDTVIVCEYYPHGNVIGERPY